MPAPSPADGLSRRMAWTVALVATFTMTVSQLDRTTLAVLAPTVTDKLDISDAGYGWLSSAFSISYLLVAPLAGWWLDRAGARRGLVISVLAWSAIAGLHSIALGFGSLFALRLALAAAEAPSYPGAAQTIQRVLPPGDRARGFGVLFTGSSIGVMIAAPLAGWLYAELGWRLAFLGSAVIGLSWVPLWAALTSRADVRARLEQSPTPAASTAPAAPGAWHRFAREPAVLRAGIAVVAAAPVQGFAILWGAKYLVRAFGIDQSAIGHYLWLPAVAFDVGAVVFGDLAARQRRAAPGGLASGADDSPRALFGAAAVLAACLAWLPFADSAWMAMAIVGVSMFGSAGLYTLAVADLLPRVPPSRVGLTGGLLPAAQSLILIIAGPVIGASVTATHSYSPISIALGLWTLPGALAWILWRPRAPVG